MTWRAGRTGVQEVGRELGAILADMEEAIDRFGRVNLLVYVPEMPRPDLGAVVEDLQFAREHTKDVGRYAAVGGVAPCSTASQSSRVSWSASR